MIFFEYSGVNIYFRHKLPSFRVGGGVTLCVMEPKDLKNSEELMRQNSDDSVNEIDPIEVKPKAGRKSQAKKDVEVALETPAEPAAEVTTEADVPAVAESDSASDVGTIAATTPESVETTAVAPEAAESDAAVILESASGLTESVTEPVVAVEELGDVAEEAGVIADAEVEVSIEVPAPEVAQAEAVVSEITTPAAVVASEAVVTDAPAATEIVELAVAEEEQEEVELDEILEMPDYPQYSQIELVNTLREIVEGTDKREKHIPLIAAAFRQLTDNQVKEQKAKFLSDGGSEEAFVPDENPYESDINDLIKQHRQNKFEQSRKMEADKETNLQLKYAIIEDIKNLLNNEESINKTFQDFRELQKRWYDMGPVPQAKMKDLWDTYHFHVENFYDYIKINKELRDLDLKRNLEAKIGLCEKAEELLLEPSVIRAFNTLQKFHEQWREIGPVPRDKKDDLWERFKAVTSQINLKHQEFFEKRKTDQKKNLDAKIALCEKAEELGTSSFENHKDWDEKSRELVELQKVWRTIGFAPKRDNNKIYNRFRTACDKFFSKKREFYSQSKDLQNKNMQMKIDLCLEAEALKESTDWKKATQQFIDIQKRWKEAGPVPRKHSDGLWKRFRAACDHFFENKSRHFSDVDDDQGDNLKQKLELIDEVTAFEVGSDVAAEMKGLRDFQRRWTEIGHVPIKEKDKVQAQFRAAINKHFDALNLDDAKRDSINFRSKISNLTDNQRGLSKIRQEREKYMIKLKQLESDLILLDNNIGFFANSKNAQALIADVNQKITDTRERIEQLKEKIRIIDDLDKSEY